MGMGFTPRWFAGSCAALAVSLVPLTLSGVTPLGDFGTGPGPRARAAVRLDAGAFAWQLSRSATRFTVLEQIDPDTFALSLGGHGKGSDRDRKVEVTSPKGTRVWTASALADHDVPQAAMRAYKNAAAQMAREAPTCGLPWTLLAAIGRVESDHGRYGGAILASDGVSHPAILGVPLNGAGPVAAIHDTDGGLLDHDVVWDRAVGPMQFIPSTWSGSARDGDGDGTSNPNDIDDAALATAAYLCSGGTDLRTDAGMRSAIYRYNQSDYYVALVMAFERGYRTGAFVIPSPPPPPEQAAGAEHGKKADGKKHHGKADDKAGKHSKKKRHGEKSDGPTGKHPAKPDPKATGTTSPTSGPTKDGKDTKGTPSTRPSTKPSSTQSGSSTPSPTPSETPSSTGSPTPSQTPSTTGSPTESTTAPALSSLSGVLGVCDTGWCVSGTTLDVGPDWLLARTAAHDYDADGRIETNADELDGLVGRQVALLVEKRAAASVVYVVQGLDYRYADGSFA